MKKTYYLNGEPFTGTDAELNERIAALREKGSVTIVPDHAGPLVGGTGASGPEKSGGFPATDIRVLHASPAVLGSSGAGGHAVGSPMTEERLKEIERALYFTHGVSPVDVSDLFAELRRREYVIDRCARDLAELRDFREAVEAFLEPQHSHHLNVHRLEQTLAKWSRP